MLIIISSTLILLLLPSTTSLPAGRRQVATELPAPYIAYLQSQGVSTTAFYPLPPGNETKIVFAGVTNSSDMFQTNEAIFSSVDLTPGNLSFSTQYHNFTTALERVMPQPSAQALNTIATLLPNFTQKCDALSPLRASILTAFRKQGGNGSFTDDSSDPVVEQFAIQNYPNYFSVGKACNDSRDAWYKARYSAYGSNIDAIQNTIDPGPLAGPGSMPISSGTDASSAVPYYAIPSLNSTLFSWQTSPTDALPAFSWNSTHSNTGQQSISFRGIGLIDIERGSWFDNFKSAPMLENPPADDPVAADHRSIFSQYFGTDQSPGPASKYNDKALVVYKPKTVFKCPSQSACDGVKKTPAPSSGLWSGPSNWIASGDLELTFAPDTQDAYIVGFLMRSYWDERSSSTVHQASSP
ncbi:hypothetical protein DFH09DRAFT_1359104 [Mycena vulgaris]|nr:hypothetical protein DFH09DRAFT_1359104 [Mycena vulgaris]